MFEVGKTYKTRGGWTARVICVDAKSSQPVVALHDCHDHEALKMHNADGAWCSLKNSHDDLMLPETVIYANIYGTSCAGLHPTKAVADENAQEGRIACVKITYRPGQYDE